MAGKPEREKELERFLPADTKKVFFSAALYMLF
jgi:hypothetical protein